MVTWNEIFGNFKGCLHVPEVANRLLSPPLVRIMRRKRNPTYRHIPTSRCMFKRAQSLAFVPEEDEVQAAVNTGRGDRYAQISCISFHSHKDPVAD